MIYLKQLHTIWYVTGSIKSHCFCMVGDGHQPNRRGSYTPYTVSLLKSGMTILQKKRYKKIMVWTPFQTWPIYLGRKNHRHCQGQVERLHLAQGSAAPRVSVRMGTSGCWVQWWLPVGVSWISHSWGLENWRISTRRNSKGQEKIIVAKINGLLHYIELCCLLLEVRAEVFESQ